MSDITPEELERPPVEDIMRLTANPDSPWGMADIDAQNICRWLLIVEAELALRTAEVTALKKVNEELRGRLEKAERVVSAALVRAKFADTHNTSCIRYLSTYRDQCDCGFKTLNDALSVYSKET